MQLAADSKRHSANASVHRTMNERRGSARLRFLPKSITCECECNRAECGHNIEITIADYEGSPRDRPSFHRRDRPRDAETS